MFLPIRRHYFSTAVNREVKEIYWNAFIVNFAVSITTLFEPIFLYSLHYSLIQILWFYSMVYLAYCFLIFPAAKIVSWIGYKHAIVWSNVFYILYWILLYQIQFNPALFLLAPVFFALQKSFFWPPYHADIAINSRGNQRGREVGLLFALIQVATVAGPFVGGVISATLGFKSLFFISSSLMLFSAYPLFRSEEIFPRHTFRFANFLKVLRKYPQNFFAYFGYAEDLMLMTLWPVYVFLIVPGLLDVGFLVTVASFLAVVVMLYVGRLSDTLKPAKLRYLLQSSSVAYGLTWLLRQSAYNFLGVFIFDALGRSGKAAVNVPMTDQTYKLAGSSTPDYAIGYTVFYEFSLSIGKIATALGCMWILKATGNIYYAFVFAGTLTMFYGFLKGKTR